VTLLEKWKKTYREAHPFPHIVLDGFLHPNRAERVAAAFPGLTDLSWYVYDNVFERKFATDKIAEIPETLCDLMWDLNSSPFLAFLEELSGIPNLIADASFRGGGLHCVATGGKLDIHADFNIHPITGLHRRLNAILFLNKNWKADYGGAFELWSSDMTKCVKQIFPEFNRMVIFTVTDTSFHGHPEPLRTPEDVMRKSMAWYYYTEDRPGHQKSPIHSTLYQRRPTDPRDKVVEALRKRRSIGRLSDSTL